MDDLDAPNVSISGLWWELGADVLDIGRFRIESVVSCLSILSFDRSCFGGVLLSSS